MKIALIAMSGVRAQRDDLTRLGMTMPGFAGRRQALASLPSLGLLTLAGMTPDRFDVSYHEVADLRALDRLPECDLAAISSFTAQVKDAYALAARFRAAGVPTVLGGLHATALPEEAARHVDAVVVGEGELHWQDVLRDAERGRLRDVYPASGREFDLADAPLPRFDLLDPDRYNRITVQTTRGCPWRCEFCASSILLTRRYKPKPVAKVVAELRAIKQIWPRPFIEFADDNSFVNRRHARALLEAVAAERIQWFTETDISIADDPALLDLMRASGCVQVLVGLESPSAAALEGVETRRNWKRSRLATYRPSIERMQERGIAVNGCFVLGLDGSTTDDFSLVREFVDESGLYEVQISVLTAFPGTPLYRRLLAEERLLDPTAWERCTIFDVNVRPQQMSVAALEQGLRDLAATIYSAEAKAARTAAFRRQRRAHRRRMEGSAADGVRSESILRLDRSVPLAAAGGGGL
ncbi:MAG TPA: radical SAM protein [Thermomicrobiales bacterium]|nr:radical SAM protein [Thermomicrobiales bacterium]